MQVAADVLELEEIRGRIGSINLAQLRWPKRTPDVGVHLQLTGSFGERPQARHILRRPGRSEERGSEARRRCSDHLDRDALDGDADGAIVLPLEHGDDLREPLEPK